MNLIDRRGERAEELLAQIISDPLLVDFVHLRPYYQRVSRHIELCDLLIEDASKSILVQLKVQDLSQGNPGRNPQRWARKRIGEASRQIIGALRWVSRVDIFSENPVRGSIRFSQGDLAGQHGLVILDYSSGPMTIESELPRRTAESVPIHYFSFEDFVILCQSLQTLPDLIHYLDERAKIPAWSTPKLNDERNAYAYFLMNQGTFNSSLVESDFDGQWYRLTHHYRKEYGEKLRADEMGKLFSQILHHIHNADPERGTYTPQEIENMHAPDNFSPQRIAETARLLNRLRNIDRRNIVERLWEKIEKADDSYLGYNYFAYRPEVYDLRVMYLFLASRHDRSSRLKQLFAMAVYVLNIVPDAEFVAAASTESRGVGEKNGRSFDFLLIDKNLRDTDPQGTSDSMRFFGQLEWTKTHDFPSENRRIIVP